MADKTTTQKKQYRECKDCDKRHETEHQELERLLEKIYKKDDSQDSSILANTVNIATLITSQESATKNTEKLDARLGKLTSALWVFASGVLMAFIGGIITLILNR